MDTHDLPVRKRTVIGTEEVNTMGSIIQVLVVSAPRTDTMQPNGIHPCICTTAMSLYLQDRVASRVSRLETHIVSGNRYRGRACYLIRVLKVSCSGIGNLVVAVNVLRVRVPEEQREPLP